MTTYVSGKHFQEYIPLYIYSTFKSYSDYYPLIFCGESLLPHISSILKELSKIGDFEVIENYLPELHSEIDWRCGAVKWLLYSPKLLDYEYAYIGDADLFLIVETPSLAERQIQNMKDNNLIYSNALRRTYDFKRFEGAMCIKTNEYFKVMLPIMEEYKQILKTIPDNTSGGDEYMLYDMITKSNLGLPTIQRSWYHGLHLGLFRSDSFQDCNIDYIIRQLRQYDDFYYYRTYLNITENDSLFQQIKNNTQDELMIEVYKNIETFKQYIKL